MKLFILNRKEDETGVSGTGIVAQGVEFDNGKCVLTWLSKITSIIIYESIQDIEQIHGHGGKTLVEFLPPEQGES